MTTISTALCEEEHTTNKELRNKYRADEISAIEDQYGMLFRMALSHLWDVGFRHITPEAVDEAKAAILAEKTEGIPVMTPGFQCQLLDLALELTQFSLWELLSYVKTDLFIG